MYTQFVKGTVSLAIGLLIGAAVSHITTKARTAPVERVIRDTCYVTRVDTFVRVEPRPYRVYVTDTMRVQVVTEKRDTIWAELPREVKEYRDTSYYAKVSGFSPSLDAIEVYQRTKTITITERVKPSRWGVGVTAGYGLTTNGIAPYIGIGLNYNLFTF